MQRLESFSHQYVCQWRSSGDNRLAEEVLAVTASFVVVETQPLCCVSAPWIGIPDELRSNLQPLLLSCLLVRVLWVSTPTVCSLMRRRSGGTGPEPECLG